MRRFVKNHGAFFAEQAFKVLLPFFFVARNKAFKTEGPYVIDCKIDKDEFVLPMLPPGGSMDDIITKLEVEL